MQSLADCWPVANKCFTFVGTCGLAARYATTMPAKPPKSVKINELVGAIRASSLRNSANRRKARGPTAIYFYSPADDLARSRR